MHTIILLKMIFRLADFSPIISQPSPPDEEAYTDAI